jgi:protein SCO1/2
MKRMLFWLFLGLFGGLVLAGGLILSQPHKLTGSVIDPPVTAGSIDLGNFHLAEQKGKVVVLFFGYTYCPDVCPSSLSEFKEVLKNLGGQAENVDVLFITVDPKRDTPEKISQYARAFDPRIQGLSGSMAELEPIWKAYGVYRAEQPSETEGAYLVDHSSRTYLIDRQGNLRVTFTYGTPVDDILSDVKFLLNN